MILKVEEVNIFNMIELIIYFWMIFVNMIKSIRKYGYIVWIF